MCNTLAVLKHLFDFLKVERYQVHNIISHTSDGSLVTETILQAPEFCFIASGLLFSFYSTSFSFFALLYMLCSFRYSIYFRFARNLFS